MAGAHPGLQDRILLTTQELRMRIKYTSKRLFFVMYRSPQVRTQEGAKPPLEKFSSPQENCFGHILKPLDIVLKTVPF